MAGKLFTVEEANRMLPALREVVTLLKERMGWMASNKPELSYLQENYKIPLDSPVPWSYFDCLLQVRAAISKIESLGCQLKDINRGLVDFPAKLAGRDVLLCWHLGEESVAYYHDLHSGYAGRQPLPEGGGGAEGGAGGETH